MTIENLGKIVAHYAPRPTEMIKELNSKLDLVDARCKKAKREREEENRKNEKEKKPKIDID